MNQPCVLIMAGGAGTRFWPVSTRERPKQLIPLLGGRSLLQESCSRALSLTSPEGVLVVTGAHLVPAVSRQLPEIPIENIVGEPMRRDTAAAVCLAMLLAERRLEAAGAVVLTADHLVDPIEEFTRSLRSALAGAAKSGALYTLGIAPTHPATGYGYLRRGPKQACIDGISHYTVEEFVEKPDRDRAVSYLEAGGHFWNSGMFAWSVSSILGEIERLLPRHFEELSAALDSVAGPVDPDSIGDAYGRLPSISIDRGVMEKAERVRMVVASFAWVDVGGWPAAGQLLPEDDRGNRRNACLAAEDATDNLVFAEDPEELVALLGVHGLVVVRSKGRTLVMPRDRAEELKTLVEKLDDQSRRDT